MMMTMMTMTEAIIPDDDKQDNSHDTVPRKGDNLNICLPVVHYQQKGIGCYNCELDLRE